MELILNHWVFVTTAQGRALLTGYGRSLEDALKAICEWGQIHMQLIGAIEKSPNPMFKTNRSARQAAKQRA